MSNKNNTLVYVGIAVILIAIIILVWLITKKEEKEEEDGEFDLLRKGTNNYVELLDISPETNQIFFSAYNQKVGTITQMQTGYSNWLTSITYLHTSGFLNKIQYENIKKQIEDWINNGY